MSAPRLRALGVSARMPRHFTQARRTSLSTNNMAAEIQLHNTMGGKKEAFTPLKLDAVRIYTCGPTVYDFAHIGNFRTFMFQDLLRRFLRVRGYKVFQVMNLTDVDD